MSFRNLSAESEEIKPIKASWSTQILDEDEVKQIHNATLEVLKDTGVHFPSREALEIFDDAGAKVDFDEEIVKFSDSLVEDALEKAPRNYNLAARGGSNLNVQLQKDKGTYFGTTGAVSKVINLKSGKIRAPKRGDLEEMIRVVDYLPYISFHLGPIVTPQDVPKELASLYELETTFNLSSKHVQTASLSGKKRAEYAIEMASIIAGGEENLRKNPILSSLICTVAPLSQDKGGIEAAIAFAQSGVPVGFMAMPTMGTTAPASQVGALVVGNAEVLSGVVLLQLVHPGAPVFYSVIPALSDRRTGEYFYGSPLAQVANAAAVQLSHFYEIPVLGGASFGGASYELDSWQVGKENIYLPLLTVLQGADFAVGLGVIGDDNLLCRERVIFDNEIIQAVQQVSSGVDINEEKLALQDIKEVGPMGHFLGQAHTREHLGELWPPSILHVHNEGDTERKFRDPSEVAEEEFQWILDNHQPDTLDSKTTEELTQLLNCASEDLT